MTIAKIRGVPLRLHFSFFVLFAMIYWTGGDIRMNCAIFVCVVLHEFGHVLMARHYGIATESVTLFCLGGVAKLEREPENPWQDMSISLTGPLTNFLIASLVSLGFWIAGYQSPFWKEVWIANTVMGLFNLIPAFPLDGGRILRAALAVRYGQIKATKIAGCCGQVFGFVFLILGTFGPTFLCLIGVFIFATATAHLFDAIKQGKTGESN